MVNYSSSAISELCQKNYKITCDPITILMTMMRYIYLIQNYIYIIIYIIILFKNFNIPFN